MSITLSIQNIIHPQLAHQAAFMCHLTVQMQMLLSEVHKYHGIELLYLSLQELSPQGQMEVLA